MMTPRIDPCPQDGCVGLATGRGRERPTSGRMRLGWALTLGLGFGGSTGCDLSVTPPTADYEDRASAWASVTVSPVGEPTSAAVREVELTLGPVALVRPVDGRRVLLSGDAAPLNLLREPRSGSFRDVPLHFDTYGRISFAVESARVLTSAGWDDAEIIASKVEVEGDFVVDADVQVELTFDVSAGLQRIDGRFFFEPLVTAEVL